MLYFIFIIPLILPGLALEENEQQKKKHTCTDPRVKAAGDEFFACFNDRVKNRINHQNGTCNIKEIISNYTQIANATCYKDSSSKHDATLFNALSNFSLRKDSFKDFVKNNGTECIQAIKKKFRCVSTVTGIVDSGDKYDALWKKTQIHTYGQKACSYTIQVRDCTLNAMRAEKGKCESIDTLLYVGSLFNAMIENCYMNGFVTETKEETRDKLPPIDEAAEGLVKEAHTTQVLLVLLLTMAFLGILYVLYRDCRVKNGSWKSINENFEMGRRRRSLVNNEMCHPGTAPPASK